MVKWLLSPLPLILNNCFNGDIHEAHRLCKLSLLSPVCPLPPKFYIGSFKCHIHVMMMIHGFPLWAEKFWQASTQKISRRRLGILGRVRTRRTLYPKGFVFRHSTLFLYQSSSFNVCDLVAHLLAQWHKTGQWDIRHLLSESTTTTSHQPFRPSHTPQIYGWKCLYHVRFRGLPPSSWWVFFRKREEKEVIWEREGEKSKPKKREKERERRKEMKGKREHDAKGKGLTLTKRH